MNQLFADSPNDDGRNVGDEQHHLGRARMHMNPHYAHTLMQVAPNGGDASELETQYNPISDRYLNESIFSENTYP